MHTTYAADPEELLVDWATAIGDAGDFLQRLDEALPDWVRENWEISASDTSGGAARLAVAWCRLADITAYIGTLHQTAQA